ncbi:hypothetical protein [Paenibacillus xylaniclasticus]|uniref:hypothetical protein n=1 Tax=Paenibacillus xylaniclasticus TaxID=588083 RepID=UPI000FD7136B|nr:MULTISPECIES: hypothetical protein [Paenibacillus]GFN32466.1 hypothetical protein PCURB6_27260 [Paenibacillus curdlanolyticus]
MSNIAVVNPEITCFKCLQEKDVKQIYIPSKGYGSGFDSWSTQINLCDECYKLTNPSWWELKDADQDIEEYDEWYGSAPYKYEDEIFKFAKSLEPAGRELFWNRYASHSHWEPQDYIDYELGNLSHEKCEEYGVYSPQVIEAYQTRFPTCQHPVHIIYDDGTVGCQCPFGALGREGQTVDLNIWDNCYRCTYYQVRETTIREFKREDLNDYEIYYKAKLNHDKYKSKFE